MKRKIVYLILVSSMVAMLTACSQQSNTSSVQTEEMVEEDAAVEEVIEEDAAVEEVIEEEPEEEPVKKTVKSYDEPEEKNTCQFKNSDGSTTCTNEATRGQLCESHFNELNSIYNDMVGY